MTDSRFLATLKGQQIKSPPMWFMRQAGRYLPEYRAIREKAGGFLDLCYNPDLASEVTLQPVERFDLDAAILFADILLIPHALGQKVWFVAGEGPRLDPAVTANHLSALRDQYDPAILEPVIETVRLTRKRLADDKALIGFAGAPWTVATYMLGGGPSKDPSAWRRLAYSEPDFLDGLISVLTEATIDYLDRQIQAGVDAVQLFDSWAEGLPPAVLDRVSRQPMVRIAETLQARHPGFPVIFFPKGSGVELPLYAKEPGCTAIGIDTSIPPAWARAELSPHTIVQGGLDPLVVVVGGDRMERAAAAYFEAFADVPYIFNLGHGFIPETPPENVAHLVSFARQWG